MLKLEDCLNYTIVIVYYLRSGVGVLEVQVVLAVLGIELRGRDVRADLDFVLVAGLLDRVHEDVERLVFVFVWFVMYIHIYIYIYIYTHIYT